MLPTASRALPPRACWTLVFLLPLAAAVVAHTCFRPGFQTNDDVGMCLMAAGVILAPEPSAHLLYINPAIGYPVSRLYAAAPALPWYYAAHLLTHLVAGMVVVHAVLAASPSRVRAALTVAVFLTVDVMLYTLPQFTITAALPVSAAAALWLSRSADRPWGRQRWPCSSGWWRPGRRGESSRARWYS